MGISVDGEGIHVLGGGVLPATHVSVIELAYPFIALAVPLMLAVCPAKTVCEELDKLNE